MGLNINMKKSKYDAFMGGGIALLIVSVASFLFNHVLNIYEQSFWIQFIFCIFLFSFGLILINKKISDKLERKTVSQIIIICAIVSFSMLILSLIKEKYNIFWNMYINTISILVIIYFEITCIICGLLIIRYKKYSSKR